MDFVDSVESIQQNPLIQHILEKKDTLFLKMN